MAEHNSPRTGVVLVGLGRQGRRHLRVAGSSNEAEVIATVDPAAEPVAGISHFRTLSDAMGALGGRAEAAIVSTPAVDHLASASTLLRAGVPTLLEKPLGATIEDGVDLVTTAEQTGTLLAVGHVERFNPCVQLAAALLRGGTVGAPVACSFRRVGLPPPSRPDVDVIADLGVHDLDVFRMLMGRSVSFRGASGWIGSDGLVESAHVLVSAGPVHGLIEVNWRTPVRLRGFSITTETCLVEVNYTTQSVEVVEASRVKDFEEFAAFQSHYGAAQRTRLEAQPAEPLAAQFEAFIGAVGGVASPVLATGGDGLGVIELAATASAAIHQAREES